MQTPDSLGWADLQGGLDSGMLGGWTTLTLQQSPPRGQRGRAAETTWLALRGRHCFLGHNPTPPPDLAELEEVRMASFVPLN